MIHPFPVPEAGQYLRLLVSVVRRDQERNGFSDDFFRTVAEQPLGALVPASDDTAKVLANDRVVRGIHDRAQ